MFPKIPEKLQSELNANVTLEEVNSILVKLHVPALVFTSVLMIVGVTGNCLVLCIYMNSKASTYRRFILWLASVDLFACVLGKPYSIVNLFRSYTYYSGTLCRLLRFLHGIIILSGVFIFLAISYERYKKICCSRIQQLSCKRVNMNSIFCIVLAALTSLPCVVIFGDATVDTGVYNITGKTCFIDDKYKRSAFSKIYFIFMLVFFISCTCLICTMYAKIWRTLNVRRKFLTENTYTPKLQSDVGGTSDKTAQMESADGRTHKKSKEDDKPTNIFIEKQTLYTQALTKMFFIVTVVSISSYLPFVTLTMLKAVSPKIFEDMSSTGVVLYSIFIRSPQINNVANPIVYFICLKSFRTRCFEKFRQLCRVCRKT